MTEEDISDALSRRLVEGLPDHRVILENRDHIPTRPYIVTEVVRVSTTDDTLEGGHKVHRGFLQATVISEIDEFANPGLRTAAEIVALFPKALRFAAGDGEILIPRPPAVQQAFRDGPDWRTPVRVDYEAK